MLLELKTMRHGQALRELLEEELKEINSVEGCETLEEVKGKQLAKKTIDRIFAFLNSKPASNTPKSSYN